MTDVPVRFEDRSMESTGSHVSKKYVEVMVVSDSTMFDYHGNDLENYLTTLMNIVSIVFFYDKNFSFTKGEANSILIIITVTKFG